jgi:hypothetical protein
VTHSIRRSVCGPLEYELRVRHRVNQEIFIFTELSNSKSDLEGMIEYGTRRLLAYIFQKWYQDHGNGD